MAITVTTPSPGKSGFIINGVSANASGCEELKAGVSGKSIIVDHLTINNGATAQTITIGEGETGGAVTGALIGPINMAANSSLQFNFGGVGGMSLAAASALVVDAGDTGAVCIFAVGRVE
jgi:hypothetical protein